MFLKNIIDCTYDEIKCLAKQNKKEEIIECFSYDDIKYVFDKLSIFYNMANEKTRPEWSNVIYEIIHC